MSQKKILIVETSPNGESSQSKNGAKILIRELKKKYSDLEIKVRDLDKNPVPHLNGEVIQAMFTKENERSIDQKNLLKLSDELTDELLWAEEIIIATPMWNFSVPSVLKSWVDHVSRAGKTFSFTENGLVGLASGRKVYVVVSSGSVFSEGSFASFDALAPFVKSFFGFIGMSDVNLIRFEGLNDPNNQANAFSKGENAIKSILA